MIPADIIKHICEELLSSSERTQPETPLLSSVALQKHLKNCDIRAVSHVCRSWRSHATAFVCLWRDIAFDVTDPKSTRLAEDFLSLVESQGVLLHVYAGFGSESASQDSSIANLFNNLCRHIGRWEVFEYQGSLGDYRSYMNLPAPNLLYFSDHHDPSPTPSRDIGQLFAGHTPSLHYLLTSTTAGWDSTTLNKLTKLHFERLDLGPALSLDSLLNLLQGVPGLEILCLGWLGFIHDCAADTIVSLPQLHTLQVHNADFYTLLEHIQIPNVREATLTADTSEHPSFQAPHALAWLPSISILNQHVSDLMVVVAGTTEEGDFRIRLSVSGGGYFDIRLVWEAGHMQNWKTYVSETLSALAERIRLDPEAILRLYLGVRPARRSSSEGALKIQGSFAQKLLQVINHENTRAISTPLTRSLLIVSGTSILDEDETQMFQLCLRSRTTCEVGLVVRLRHGDSPWLCIADFECPEKCEYSPQTYHFHFLNTIAGREPHRYLELEFRPHF